MPDLDDGPLAASLVDALSVDGATLLPRTTDAVLRATLQILGVCRLGASTQIASSGIAYVIGAEPGSTATVVTRGRRASAAGAAFANTLASHSDFREDTHAESQTHPGVVVIPAVLAVIEAAGEAVGPHRFTEAVVAGYELTCRLGRATAIQSTARGFRAPSLYPVFGAALGAAMALGLDANARVHALAIASQGAGGVNQPFAAGTDDWFLAPAFAARQGVTAALLAAAGVQGSPAALDGEAGVFDAFAGTRRVAVDRTPLRADGAFEVERTRLKANLTCGFNQSLVHQLGQLSIPAAKVRRVHIGMSPGAATYPGVAKTGPFATRTAALLSAPFATATTILRGPLSQSSYGDLSDADVVDLASRVSVSPDDSLEGYATTVYVALDDDTVLRSRDGNEAPGFSLDTVERVAATLRRNYEADGQDPERIDGLLEAVVQIMADGDPTQLSAALT